MTEPGAGEFGAAYASVRAREPWAERDRKRRESAVAQAVELIRRELGANASIVSVGAGDMRLPGVITSDLLRIADVQADMRALPFADGSIDGALYAASLHYAPVAVAIAEAGRILRPGGLFIAIDSPIYPDKETAAAAKARSVAYYAGKGVPGLATHYHPIDLADLIGALAAGNLEVKRLDIGSPWRRRLLRRGPRSFVLARKLR